MLFVKRKCFLLLKNRVELFKKLTRRRGFEIANNSAILERIQFPKIEIRSEKLALHLGKRIACTVIDFSKKK